MGTVIGDILPVALGVAISPIPVIAVILMLLGPHARSTGLGFLLGWVAGVTVVVTLITLVVDPVSGDSTAAEPSSVASTLKLLLGLTLIGLAARQWHGRPRAGTEPTLPHWMAAISSSPPLRALGLGALLAGLNPKNLTLSLAGGVSIGSAGLTVGEAVVVVLVFVVVASASVAVPVGSYLLAGDRMAAPLEELREWLTANNAAVMSVLLLVMGTVVFGKALAGL